MNVFGSCFRRDFLLLLRRPAELINTLFFFVMVVSLFPLALTAVDSERLLVQMAPAILWVAALLASMLSLGGLFRHDFEAGAIEQLLCAPVVLYVPVLARLLAHWLVISLPLVLLSPVLGYMLHLPTAALGYLCLGLLLGTPTLTIVGAIGAALTLGLNRGSMLLALLVLPLYVPVLIFGAGLVVADNPGVTHAVLAILCALLALATSLGPLAVAQALKISSGN
jgi:heme exporter protein B